MKDKCILIFAGNHIRGVPFFQIRYLSCLFCVVIEMFTTRPPWGTGQKLTFMVSACAWHLSGI